MKIFFIFFVFMISACTIFIGKRESLWSELDNTQAVSCEKIAPPLNHLGLMDIMLIKDLNNLSFLIKSKSRLGENKFYTYQIPQSAGIDEESFMPIDINADSEWAGSGKSIWGMYESTLEADGENPSDKVVLKLHYINSSKQSLETMNPILLSNNPDKVYISEAKNGIWITDQKDSKFNLRYLSVDSNNGTYKETTISKSFYARPAPFNIRDNTYVIFLEETGGDLIADETTIDENTDLEAYLDADNLEAASINLEANPITNTFRLQNSNQTNSSVLELPTESGVENWSMHPHSSGFYLAYFEGDSLVGQAKLHLANYLISMDRLELAWLKTFPMNHIHVGDLEWINFSNDTVILHFLKWLDGEATLASFSLAKNDVNPLKNQGIFPGGSTLMKLFATKPDENIYYGLIRHRSGAFWQFNICQLNLN